MTLKHAKTSAACQAPKGEKKKMCFGTVCCILDEGHKLLEQTLDLLVQCMFCCQCTF